MTSNVSKSPGKSRIREPVLSLLLLLFTPGIILWYAWWGRFQYRSGLMLCIVYVTLALVLLFNHHVFLKDLKSQGFRTDNLMQSVRMVAPVTVVLAGAVLYYGWLHSQWHFEQLSKIPLYLLWGVAQQYTLQNLLLARSKSLFRSSPVAIIAASAIFAVVHIPTVELVAFSFVGAVAWCWIFSRVPNLWTLALSHAFLVVLLLVWTGPGFSIGKPGHRYEAYGGGVIVAGGYFKDKQPFVATLPGNDEGVPSLVKIFSPDGTFIRQWQAFPEYDFSGNLAVGNLGSGFGDSIAVAPGPASKNPGRIRVFTPEGRLQIDFEIPDSRGYGAYVAIGCGKIYVTPGPAPSQAARIMEFDATGTFLREWRPEITGLVSSIRAFPVKPARAGDYSNQCPEKIALFGSPISVNPYTLFLMNAGDGSIQALASAAPTYGLNAAPFEGSSEVSAVITAPGPLRGYGPHVRIYTITGQEIFSRVPYEDLFACGSNVASVDVDGDGKDEIILGNGICDDSPPVVRVYDFSGDLLYRWNAYSD